MRMERTVKRLRDLTQEDDGTASKLDEVLTERSKSVNSGSVLSKYSIWRRDTDENSDSLVRLMRDQLIMARVYSSIAQSHKQPRLLNDLRQRIKESQRTLGEANTDADLQPRRFGCLCNQYFMILVKLHCVDCMRNYFISIFIGYI